MLLSDPTDRRTAAAPSPAPPAPRAPQRHGARSATAVRPEIQALRAIAVMLVVLYHLWPGAVPGGFIGVDVFFVISGFLITSLLLREIDKTGRLSLRDFWARRARRILPAALMTLFVCALATVAFVPMTYWAQYFADLRASTGYVQNWHLASTAVDYFAADNAPSPAQHYWSLSVEEQFYLGWPVMMVCAMVLVRGRSLRAKRLLITLAMSALTAWSLLYCLRATTSDPGPAYFITSTRAWEFGAGGLLALYGRSDGDPAARSALQWAGLAAIAVAGLTYTDHTPFPGTAALLPVLGTMAVIRAGAPTWRIAPTPLLGLRPVQFVGDVSYAVYLWHWPLLILAPFVLRRGTDTTTSVVILMLTLLFAWLSKVLVEDPVRSGPLLTSRPLRWTFASAIVATAVVMGVNMGGTAYVQAKIHGDEQVAARVLAHRPPCFGAAARDRRNPCTNAKLAHSVVPSPQAAPQMRNLPCAGKDRHGLVSVCHFGSTAAKPAATVALIGDSHASHWRAALDVVARTERWRGLSITRTGCSFAKATQDIPEPGRAECTRWNRQVPQWLARHPEVTIAFIVNHTGGRLVLRGGGDMYAAQVRAAQGAWASLPASIKHIIVIRDTPKMRSDTLACIERAMKRGAIPGSACAQPRGRALDRDPQLTAARRMASPRVQSIDMTPFLCDSRRCWPVIGGALVYKDIHHLTTVFATTLGPYVGRDVSALMAGWT